VQAMAKIVALSNLKPTGKIQDFKPDGKVMIFIPTGQTAKESREPLIR